MSTHKANCVVCSDDCYCCNDNHVFSLTGCNDNNIFGRAIEFCSADCFLTLLDKMNERYAFVQSEAEFRDLLPKDRRISPNLATESQPPEQP